jgi:hypothetical protein
MFPAASQKEDSARSAPSPAGGDADTARLVGIKLSGTVEGQMRYMRDGTLATGSPGAVGDLYLRLLEIGIEADVSNWASAIAVLNSEWIGDYVMAGDERMTVDEMHFDLRRDPFPLYFILGKRTLPFGVFENVLVSDPMTQDAYETQKVGAVFGCALPGETDVSISAYKGDEAIGHLFSSGLFDSARVSRNPLDVDEVNSFVVAASTVPRHDSLTIFGAFSSEPGADRRNLTIDAGFSARMPFVPSLAIDVEYMRALQRESYPGIERQFRESVLAASISYSFVPIEGSLAGRGNYRARKEYKRTHPFLVSARYERFDDDSMSDESHAWSIKDRYLAGGRYTLLRKASVSAYLGAEYRRTILRVPPGYSSPPPATNDEVYLSAGMDF